METNENKYAELDKFLTQEIQVNTLVDELTAFREQCVSVFMHALIYEEKCADNLHYKVVEQLYWLRRIIELLGNIKQ